VKIRHFSLFKESIDTLILPSSWEVLRNSNQDKAYYLPHSLGEYLKKVETETPSYVASSIIAKAKKTNLLNLFSIGSGIASLEYQVKKFSSLRVIVSDYTRSILRIKDFMLFDQCLILDALKDPLPVNKEYIVLFPRIDTEFEDDELKTLFKKCHEKNVEYIVFIPAQLLNIRIFISEIKIIIKSILLLKKRSFCGYSRSKKAFVQLFSDFYYIEEESHTERTVFFLKKK